MSKLIYIPLSKEDIDDLLRWARADRRRPQDQAAVVVMIALEKFREAEARGEVLTASMIDNRPTARDTATHGVGNLGDGGSDAAGVPANAVPGEADLRDNPARPAGSPPAE